MNKKQAKLRAPLKAALYCNETFLMAIPLGLDIGAIAKGDFYILKPTY